ncbi:hypothetical protein J6V85_00115 [Candidatus Saccharibacteria bacterium]|nr:hypothetical protein [Candidatus Saccharibacteria bacterium]
MDYFEKIEKKPKEELTWNIPEKKSGSVNVIGGNSKSFKTEVKVAEFLGEKYPIENLKLVLPDALKNQLPPLPNFSFLESTDSGSFKNEKELAGVFNLADFNLVLGDLSKNAITGKALADAYHDTKKPILLTRDAVDIFVENRPEYNLMNENLIYFASMAQLQKLLRAVYYPKMLLLSQSLVQVVEVLHKFTLSYPVSIMTLHNEQILIAKNGKVKGIMLASSGYSPIMFFQGELAAKIVALNLFNPNNFIDASVSAVFSVDA